MTANTSIEWTDRTWNPVRGCSVVSPGCVNCYAMKQAHRFRGPGKAYEGLTKQTKAGPQWTGKIRTVESALVEPLSWRKPQRIFVNSMSDLFHEGVPFEFIAAVFAVMAYCERHTFQVLTKRPERMLAFMQWVNEPAGAETFTEAYGEKAGQQITLARMKRVSEDVAMKIHDAHGDWLDLDACLHNMGAWPPKNVWLGVSVENQHFANERIPLLLRTPATVRFISAEPLLGPVHLYDHWIGEQSARDGTGPALEWARPWLDWVIVGGESGPGARPFDLAWARSLVQQCKAAGVPVFVKQVGSKPIAEYDGESEHAPGSYFDWLIKDRKGGDMAEWPEDLRVREFPR